METNPEKVIREANTYSTFNELVTDVKPGVLTAGSLLEGIKKIKEISKQPWVTHFKSQYPFWELLDKSQDARMLTYSGIVCVQDEGVPPGFIDLQCSDGKVTRIKMSDTFINPTITRI